MRDRLIELLINTPKLPITVNGRAQGRTYQTFANIADHLLANGVIVPPVKLGSGIKVYYPVKGTRVVYETTMYGIGVDEDGNMVINPTEYPKKVIEFRGVTLGKHIFLSKKEAEAAFAERSNENAE
ncbi:MAG: hypothetical protein IJX39_04640 [Clostridia bacterium]|nr:hypothetical protein [Clostridia bacterium]